jgi:hypothetical protein
VLAGDDVLARVDGPVREVGVERDVAVAERDLDHVAVALEARLLADGDHPSRLRSPDGERAQDPDVEPWMSAAAIVAEGRGHGAGSRPGRPRRDGLGRSNRRPRERKRDEQGEHERGRLAEALSRWRARAPR